MIKKIVGILSILLLLAAPSFAFADNTQTNPNGWVDDIETDFDIDSYDEDGCFC
ncbi:MAG: hypothetical protein KAG56_10555 [Sulfurovaceae bacterium]|nr:hypothetical protein [Sulfurovaceae bacterium]